MYDNTIFDKEEITKSEKKTNTDKKWVNATAYFEDLVSNIEPYQSKIGCTTNQEQYENITNVREKHH